MSNLKRFPIKYIRDYIKKDYKTREPRSAPPGYVTPMDSDGKYSPLTLPGVSFREMLLFGSSAAGCSGVDFTTLYSLGALRTVTASATEGFQAGYYRAHFALRKVTLIFGQSHPISYRLMQISLVKRSTKLSCPEVEQFKGICQEFTLILF